MRVTLSLDFRSRSLGKLARGSKGQLYMREHQHADRERQSRSIKLVDGTTWTQEQKSEAKEREESGNHEDAAKHCDCWTMARTGWPQKQQRRENLDSESCSRCGQERT